MTRKGVDKPVSDPLKSTTCALSQFNDPVNACHRECLFLAAGPAYLDRFHLLHTSQSEVKAHIALREIAATAPHFGHLVQVACLNFHPSSDCVSIACRPDELYGDPVTFFPAVDQQVRRGVEIVDDQVE